MGGSHLAKMGLIGDFLLALIKTTVLVWGALTNWAYRIIHNSSEVVKAYTKVWLHRYSFLFLMSYVMPSHFEMAIDL